MLSATVFPMMPSLPALLERLSKPSSMGSYPNEFHKVPVEVTLSKIAKETYVCSSPALQRYHQLIIDIYFRDALAFSSQRTKSLTECLIQNGPSGCINSVVHVALVDPVLFPTKDIFPRPVHG